MKVRIDWEFVDASSRIQDESGRDKLYSEHLISDPYRGESQALWREREKGSGG